MKKRSLIFGVAVFVSMALIFLACSTDADDDESEPFTDVSELYKAGEDGLTVTSKQSGWDGTVYITVTGVAGLHVTSVWVSEPSTSAPAEWDWADITLDLSEVLTPADHFYAIKNSNQAFRYYTGSTSSFVTSDSTKKPTTPVVSGGGVGEPDVYIPTSLDETAFKWKLYNKKAGANEQALDADEITFLITSGANPKTFILEIAEYSAYADNATKVADVVKVIVDYSGVTIFDPSALVTALGGSDKATVDGKTVTLADNVSINSGATASIGNGVTLDVPTGKTLTVAGTINNSGSIEVNGTYTIATSASGTNSGTVTVKSGGEVQSYTPITGSGTNTVEAGGKVAFGKDGSDNPVYIVGGSGDTAAFTLSEGKLSYTNTSFTLDGKAALNGIAGANTSMGNAKSFLINSADQVLTVKAGGELTIAADAKFLPRITENVQPLVGEPTAGEKSAAKVIFKNGGFMWYDAGINFYDSTGTALTGTNNTYTASADTTYNWDAAAGGDAKPGWKAGS